MPETHASQREFHFKPDWFEVTQVADRVWAIREPNQWEDVVSYFVQGDTSAILIDTGMGLANIRQVLPTVTNPSVLLTHTHWDHIGSAADFHDVRVFNHEFETSRLRRGWQPEELRGFETSNFLHGFVPPENLAETFTIPGVENAKVLEDGEIIDLGGITLRAIHTPGHTPGGVCYYSEELGYLFTGDMVYPAPIYLHLAEADPNEYRKSLEKVASLTKSNLRTVFPGHNTGVATPDLFFRHLAAIKGEIEPTSVEMGEDEFGKYIAKHYDDFSLLLPRHD